MRENRCGWIFPDNKCFRENPPPRFIPWSACSLLQGARSSEEDGCGRNACARQTSGNVNRVVSGVGPSCQHELADRGLIERLERALALAAQIVLRHGATYAVYLDRLESELEAARQKDPTERAKRILATYTEEGERKAMRSSQSRLCSKDGPTP